MSEQTVGDLGEFGLIERIRARLNGFAERPNLIIGPGDDAAVWRADNNYTIATTDTMVEGVHFLPDAHPHDVGWKALASNVSDIAAMGGTPTFALVTLCLPATTPVAWIEGVYEGMGECAKKFGVGIAGGDIVSSPVLMITVALAGMPTVNTTTGELLLLRRDAARPGDAIAVSGELGGAAGGLRVLREQIEDSERARALVRRHMRPEPQVGLGQAAAPGGVRCSIDVSDGLVQDVGRICEASGCGAIVRFDDIPVDPALLAVYPADARMLAATGGEDYELVFAALANVLDELSGFLGGGLTVIGEIVADREHRVRVVDRNGNDMLIERRGWNHLRHPA